MRRHYVGTRRTYVTRQLQPYLTLPRPHSYRLHARRYNWFHQSSIVYCFFFQAEDGIRDSSVTGVQTCALPICFDENVARVVEAVKERELRAQIEKTARRKMQDARGAAREELNAAVVQTISESQSDVGIQAGSQQAVRADRLQPGAKIRVRGFSKPVIFRRLDGSSGEIEAGPLRMKVALDEIN